MYLIISKEIPVTKLAVKEYNNNGYQPPFSPIRSGPKAASKPSRQKQFPSSYSFNVFLESQICFLIYFGFFVSRKGGQYIQPHNEGP